MKKMCRELSIVEKDISIDKFEVFHKKKLM